MTGSESGVHRGWWRRLVWWFTALFVVTAIGEGALRLMGFLPVSTIALHETSFEPDPVTGWRFKTGLHRGTIGAHRLQFDHHVMDDFTRLVPSPHTDEEPSEGEIVVLGDSVMWGWGLNDAETFAAQLAVQTPHYRVVNGATPGFGMLQSARRLGQLRTGRYQNIRWIVLGVADYQIERDTADVLWTGSVALHAQGGNVFLPYGAMGMDGVVTLRPPEKIIPELPFRTASSVVRVAELFLAMPGALYRRRHALTIEEAIFRKLAYEARAAKARVVIFTWRPNQQISTLQPLWQRLGFVYRECLDARVDTPDGVIHGDGHPTAAVVGTWARCIAEVVRNDNY